MSTNKWNELRDLALKQLEEHKLQGRVDQDIVWLLDLINSSPDYYTTSSCSGRIQVAAGAHPGDKGKLRVIAKWHRIIQPEELTLVLSSTNEDNVWFSVHPPIFHVVARDLRAAKRLLVAARNSGFKHSGIQGLGKRIIVEIMSMEKIETPLRLHGIQIVGYDSLVLLVEAANQALLRGKRRLSRLAEVFYSRDKTS
ncbi:MAG: tRNA-wybutosine modification methyltransferase TYW3 [Infirmifilum sp.]|uniref:tRNA(Phe) 7-((3-amino-3-carboxypropyl)-4-demethylwyosine(37)-N(4))-methyltransferase n=1 Tax=Infirmifilum uzonense TaxID=1550241 RepID=A0A0F7CKR7_9CREN|nr:hypothetical protein [Infirmifilum uzonense]AKG38131.1 hypothetical protein MA03_00850 [Infirmifilum uzonense]